MINPHIFKAYDVRGLYPQEVNEDAARLIGRGFVAYLGAKRIAVSPDMRLSSPSMAAAFIDGATLQGADVVDYGMIATDMIYYAVGTDDLDGGAQITASHNPKQYNGCKMVRQERPLSGESGSAISGTGSPPSCRRRARRARYDKNVVDDYVGCASFVDLHLAVQRGWTRGRMVGWSRRFFRHIPTSADDVCFEVARSRITKRIRHRGEPPRHHRAGHRREGRHRDRLGRRRRPVFFDGAGDFVAGDFVIALLAEASCSAPGEKIAPRPASMR
jgi:phosphomannomutase